MNKENKRKLQISPVGPISDRQALQGERRENSKEKHNQRHYEKVRNVTCMFPYEEPQ